MFHQQFNSPPEGSFTGLNKIETVEPVKDKSNDMEQIQHRITAFEDEWKRIKQFYDDYSHMVSLSSEQGDKNKMADEIQNQMDYFLKMSEKKKQQEIENKNLLESLIKQKQREEEEKKLAKKVSQESAFAAEAQRVIDKSFFNNNIILSKSNVNIKAPRGKTSARGP